MAVAPERPAALPLMTEEEFDAWCTPETRAEFVDGKVIRMSPVVPEHGSISRFFIMLVGLFLELRPQGELVGPEVQARLRPGLRRVPDLFYVTREHTSRIGETLVEGAPDLVIEIVSAESIARDWRDKFLEYQSAGVREYWIIDPAAKVVHLYVLDAAGRYQQQEELDGRLVSTVLEGFWLKPAWLWQEPLPKVMDCLRELGVVP
jgi:Uma2 family endonuclease